MTAHPHKFLRLPIAFLMVVTVAGIYPLTALADDRAEQKDGENKTGRLILKAPETGDIGFGAWDPAASGGQVPSWTYMAELRGRYDSGRSYERYSGAKALHFFQGATPTKRIELPLKPSSVKGWNSDDEAVSLVSDQSGRFIAYRRRVLGPMEKGSRYPVIVEAKVLNHQGDTVSEGKEAHTLSGGGKFGWVGGGVQNLHSEQLIRLNGGVPLFSRFDDSFIVYFEGGGDLEYRDSEGMPRWTASIAAGPMRNVVFSPSGSYVFAACGAGKEPQSGDMAGVIGPSGQVLWKMPIIPGVYAAAFSQDERVLAMVTRDANWLLDVSSGKVLAKVPMPRVFNDDARFPINLGVSVAGNRAIVVARTIRTDKSSQDPMPGRPLGNESDAIYEFGPEAGRILAEWPAKTLMLKTAGNIYEPVTTLAPDGHWFYYLTPQGLFARQL